MKTLARMRGALLLALVWSLAWAPLGVLVGMIVDADGAMDEPWIAVGAYPGFLSAILFVVLRALIDGRRGLAEVSPARASALGAVSGLLVILLPFSGLIGTPNTEHEFWRWRFVIIGAVGLLSGLSAIVSVLVARTKRRRPYLPAAAAPLGDGGDVDGD